jgi:hypothetical protein
MIFFMDCIISIQDLISSNALSRRNGVSELSANN